MVLFVQSYVYKIRVLFLLSPCIFYFSCCTVLSRFPVNYWRWADCRHPSLSHPSLQRESIQCITEIIYYRFLVDTFFFRLRKFSSISYTAKFLINRILSKHFLHLLTNVLLSSINMVEYIYRFSHVKTTFLPLTDHPFYELLNPFC